MNTLFIDTSSNKKILLRIDKNDKEYLKEQEYDKLKAEITLITLEQLLKDADLKISDIDKIFIKKGPGSFTGLRIGIAISNALSFALSIPVNDKNRGEMEMPVYE